MKTGQILLLLPLLVACGDPPSVTLEEEWTARACVDLSDCFRVTAGDPCVESCGNAAIHIDFLPDYNARFEEAASHCFPPPPEPTGDGSSNCGGAACEDARCVPAE